MMKYLKYIRSSKDTNSSLFLDAKHCPFSRVAFLSYLQDIFIRLFYNSLDYSGHFFCIGAGTRPQQQLY